LGYTISVIEGDGSLTHYATNLDAVVEAQHFTPGDHMDIVAPPTD
jgi:hypothetical protein